MDWKGTITIGIDTNKDKTYRGNPWKIKEDWNGKRIKEFSSITKKWI